MHVGNVAMRHHWRGIASVFRKNFRRERKVIRVCMCIMRVCAIIDHVRDVWDDLYASLVESTCLLTEGQTDGSERNSLM